MDMLQNYIKGLELAEAPSMQAMVSGLEVEPESGFESGAPPDSDLLPSDVKTAVDAGSLISFVAGVPEQAKSDILLSTLFAQRAANAKYNRFTEVEDWYKMYIQVLNNIGWVSERFAFTSVTNIDGELRMDKSALAVIAAIATSNQLTVLTEGLKALEALADQSEQIRIFDFSTSMELSGNFQLGVAEMAGENAASLCLGAYYFKCSDQKGNFLFISFGEEKINFWTAAQVMTLNTTFYAMHRDIIYQRLSATIKNYLGVVELD